MHETALILSALNSIPFPLRHVSVILNGLENVNFRFKATFPLQAERFFDSVSFFKSSQHQRAVEQSLPIQQPCCKRLFISFIFSNNMKPKSDTKFIQGNLMLCNQKRKNKTENLKSKETISQQFFEWLNGDFWGREKSQSCLEGQETKN